MTEDMLSRYTQAQALVQGYLGKPLSDNDAVFAHWIQDTGCFWYVRTTRAGKQFRLVDARAATNEIAFDHQALATTLTEVVGDNIDPLDLPITNVSMSGSPLQINFRALKKRWHFDSGKGLLKEGEVAKKKPQKQAVADVDKKWDLLESALPADHQPLPSPDGKTEAFLLEDNIWIRELSTGKEWALTTDGRADYSYGRDLIYRTRVQAIWSPDSKRLFTLVLDSQGVATRPIAGYAVPMGNLRPQFIHFKMAYPGDEHVENHRFMAINVDSGEAQLADYRPVPYHRTGEVPETTFFGHKPLGWWSPDNRHSFFVDLARGGKSVRVVECDTHTGATRVVFEEQSETFVKLAHNHMDAPSNFLPLPESDELIWFSERTGWGHLYRYDLKTGECKNAITEGEWLVRDILHFDSTSRELLIRTAARDPAVSPYYRDVCKVNIDTGVLTPVITGNFDHVVNHPLSNASQVRWTFVLGPDREVMIDGVSPCGQFVVVTRSRVDAVPESLLVDRDGNELLSLETANVRALPEDWQWPEPVKLKSADGVTDIFGVVFRPSGFSADQQYPVLNYSVSARYFSALPQGSFGNAGLNGGSYYAAAALAQLGFIVVMVEGRGLPLRGKAFHDHHYGEHEYANDIEDRIAGIRQLAASRPYMDLERVGVTGDESYNNNVYALLKYSDFFKVGVIHHLNTPEFNFASWGEMFDAVTTESAATRESLDFEAFAESFDGKMLLIQGMTSAGLPVATFRLADALQRHNNDFDMLCLPNLGPALSGYTVRREWDFLVRHLLGRTPPHRFKLTAKFDVTAAED